ncbi:MAG: S24/S26 family peptidase, partial [Clostridia bacterium]|nr:S24/S26 family peptidase [Clostridia bacterium]
MNSKKLTSIDEMIPLMEERIKNGGSVSFTPMGVSMHPMLRHGLDSVVLSPAPDKLKKYDIPFYRRSNGRYVLHRVVKVGDSYTCIGDNQYEYEPGIKHS